MKKILTILTLLMYVLTGTLNAIPAKPGKTIFTQPDGTSLTIMLKGDEFVHWAETPDGYTVLQNQKGYYVYAVKDNENNLTVSDKIAHNKDNRSAEEREFLDNIQPKLKFSKKQIEDAMSKWGGKKALKERGDFPTTGTNNLVMILANFSDTDTQFTQSDFDNYMNQENYNGTGSFKDYYLEVSYGQLVMNTVVTAWVTVPNTHDYYGPQSKWGEFARDAVEAADSEVDYSQFDNDGNGEVDGVAIIHQGQGQEATGDESDIWSHSWNLSSAGYSVVNDGVTVDGYTTQPEIASGGGISTIGVMCHEFGHNLGAPDYYDTDYGDNGQYDGTGEWDMMAGGSWNDGGAVPAHHNAYTKWKYYEWISPSELTDPQQITMSNVTENSTDFYYYTTPTTNEYWLLANRQQIGFDSYIPGSGLIIYHVDEDHINSHDYSNDINVGSHQGLYPVCASASGNPPSDYGNINSAGTPFPGTSNAESFTDQTTPSSTSWAGEDTDKPLTAITESSNEISFDFMGGGNNPADVTATAVSTTEINISWNATDYEGVLVAYSTDGTFGTPTDGTNYSAGSNISGGGTVIYNGTSSNYSHTGLSAATTYYYKVWGIIDGTPSYTSGITTSATTLCDAITAFPYTQDFSSGSLPNCWDNIDNQGSGQVWEFNNPGNITFNASSAGNGFVILDSDNYGSSGSQNADLVTPSFDFTGSDEVTLSFEHYYNDYSDESATLSYSTNGGTNWTTIQTWSGSDTENAATFSQDLSAELAGESNVKFKWNYTGSYGWYWAVDDIEIDANVLTPHTVTFVVNDGADNHPITDASIDINNETITTDSNGEATVELTNGDYSYTVSKTGYDNSNGTVTVDGADITENVILNETTYLLTFEVSNQNSQAVESAEINIDNNTITTNSNGVATIDVPNGEYAYTVTHSDYENFNGIVTIADADATENVTMDTTTYTASFTVQDAGDNHAIDGATIAINNQTLTTDTNGEATIELSNGDYPYTISKDGYNNATGTVHISGADMTETVMLNEATYQLTFDVETQNDQPVADAEINIDNNTLTTDANGEATIELTNGDYDYTVTHASYNDTSGTVTIIGTTVTEYVTMISDNQPVTFVVQDADDGHAIDGAEVSIDSQSLQTDNNGEATFYLPDNTYEYTVTKNGYNDTTGSLTVAGNPVTENVSITATAYSLIFNIMNQNSQPVSNAAITINSSTLTSNTDGVASTDLVNGAYGYTVTHADYENYSDSVTINGADMTENVYMEASTYTVTFIVKDAEDNHALNEASVQISGETLTTDTNGEATIDLPNSTYNYTVNATGYDNFEGSINVDGATETETVLMNPTLYTATFVVKIGDQLVEGAEIAINDTTLTTTYSGEAYISLSNGDYDYSVTVEGYSSAQGTITINNSDITETLVLPPPAYTLTFNIDAENHPVDNATIQINETTLTTDEDGQAVIELEEGEYPFTVELEGYETISDTVTISDSDTTLNINFTGIAAHQEKQLHIYPNPSSGIVNIEYPASANITVINAVGKAVYTTKMQDMKTIRLNNLKSGIYLIQIQSTRKTYTKRLLINR